MTRPPGPLGRQPLAQFAQRFAEPAELPRIGGRAHNLYQAQGTDASLQPHRVRGWLTAKYDADFEAKCHAICETYRLAPERTQGGVETVAIDEMTGIQALERAAPTLPMRTGRVEHQEFAYIRHGTQTLIGTFNGATGKVFADIGQTRTEIEYFNRTMAKPFRWTYQAKPLAA
ncbi:hypothetical protein [Candidatus Thiosymbion oneisti]|uniref:hypothetical protein n=1 Tax=Candidatus Thiosymbion oneisti TaxID=589554 RepID=UPI00105FF168|nr:hypothetical protein [Candidatus Thiosymbion oneisti]